MSHSWCQSPWLASTRLCLHTRSTAPTRCCWNTLGTPRADHSQGQQPACQVGPQGQSVQLDRCHVASASALAVCSLVQQWRLRCLRCVQCALVCRGLLLPAVFKHAPAVVCCACCAQERACRAYSCRLLCATSTCPGQLFKHVPCRAGQLSCWVAQLPLSVLRLLGPFVACLACYA